jgi:hypothetical protein
MDSCLKTKAVRSSLVPKLYYSTTESQSRMDPKSCCLARSMTTARQ